MQTKRADHLDNQTVICPLLHILSEQTIYGQVVQNGAVARAFSGSVFGQPTPKYLVRVTP